MTDEQLNQCRKIARVIVSDKTLLDDFKSQIELAAMVDCAKNNDPYPTYDYAFSYEGLIRHLLAFETQLKPEWIDPKLHPNGKMTDLSAAEKSKTISLIKGQLRIDRGATVRDERIAGFYAWLNAMHPKTCEDLHEALKASSSKGAELEFPNLVLGSFENRTKTATPRWNALLKSDDNIATVTLIDYEKFSFNLVELSKPSPEKIESFEFGAEFLFGIVSDFDGHIMAVQSYKNETYALPISTASGLTTLKVGQNFYPVAEDEDEVIPLAESTDIGLHHFVFFLFSGNPPYFDYTPFHHTGKAIHPENLEAFAQKLESYPKRHWQLAQIKVDFR